MNIIKKYSLIAIGLLAAAASAEAKATKETSATDTVKAAKPGMKDKTYIQIYGGLNKSANENMPWTEMTQHPLSGGGWIAIGREWSPKWGWRLSVGYDVNKSRRVEECENSDTYKWNDIEAFYDVTYDLTDALFKKHPKMLDVKAFAGLGFCSSSDYPKDYVLSYTDKYYTDKNTQFAGRVGVNASVALNRWLRVGAEISHTLVGDKFNGVVNKDVAFDGRTNLSLGVTFLLLRKNAVNMTPIVRRRNVLQEAPAMEFVVPSAESMKQRIVKCRAFLDFPVSQTDIREGYRNNDRELRRIKQAIDSVLFDRTAHIMSFRLHGYASPESPYANNTRLAQGRTHALKQYVENYLRGEYEMDRDVYSTDYTPEDWDNLRLFISETGRRRTKADMWYDGTNFVETPEAPDYVVDAKEELLAVIDSKIHPDAKEDNLKQVAGGRPYEWLKQHVYPGLRHTDIEIEYVVRPYNVAESRRLIYTHPEALSLEEMYRVAQSYDESSAECYEAYIIAARQYPSDKTANLNAAIASIKTKRLRDAARYASKAGTGTEAQYVRNVINAMNGIGEWKIKDGKVIF